MWGDQSVSKERQNGGDFCYSESLLSFTVISVNFTNKMGTGELGELEPRGEGNENIEIVECYWGIIQTGYNEIIGKMRNE